MTGFNMKSFAKKPVVDVSAQMKNSRFLAPEDRTKHVTETRQTRRDSRPTLETAHEASVTASSDQPQPKLVAERSRPVTKEESLIDRGNRKRKDRVLFQIGISADIAEELMALAAKTRVHRNRIVEQLLREALSMRTEKSQ